MKHYNLYNNIDTDLAWAKVYGRICQEGLTENKDRNKSRYRLVAVAVAASVALLFGALSFFVLHSKSLPSGNGYDMLASNGKYAATLVTTLDDGSIAYLGEDAQLEYPSHFPVDKRMVRLVRGNALFDVSGNPQRPFLIETENMIIEVTGTKFDVEDSSVAVQEGTVTVALRKTSQTLSVAKGQTATVSSGKLIISQTTDPERFARYTAMLRFKSEKLSCILNVINSRGGDVVLKTTPELEDRQITVTFAGNEPAYNIAAIICNAFDLRTDIDDGATITISSRH